MDHIGSPERQPWQVQPSNTSAVQRQESDLLQAPARLCLAQPAVGGDLVFVEPNSFGHIWTMKTMP